jgi:hypothetical protein
VTGIERRLGDPTPDPAADAGDEEGPGACSTVVRHRASGSLLLLLN